MKKILMAAIIAVSIVPSMILASNGSDDHLEGGHRSSEHTGSTWTGSTWTGMTHTGTVKPPMGSGSIMGGEIHALQMAMDKLTPADKATLVKMIRDYLTSKGITLPPVRQEIKEVRKEMKEEIKDIRKNTRDAMQAKIKELRSNGKATFKEFTVTK